MAQKISPKAETRVDPLATSFDVTCVIGTVVMDGQGTENPHMAAFRLIAEHDAPGVYSFPNAYGMQTVVEVNAPPYEQPADEFHPTY